MKGMKSLLIAAALIIPGAAQANLGALYKSAGTWAILRKADPMTDAPDCTGVYKGNPRIQLTNDALTFGFNGIGGVQSYRYRLDDGAPTPISLANDIEKETGVILIGGNDFAQVESAKRFRIEVFTLLDSVVDYDVDLGNLAEALSILNGPGCAPQH